MLVLTLAIIAAMIFINALYVAAEFAAVSVRRSRVQTQADDGSKLAARLLPIINDPRRLDTYVAACQIGITLSSLIVGAFAQARLAPMLSPQFERFGGMQEVAAQSTSAVVILVVLTIVQMVFGELVPKSLALQTPTRVALLTVVPMQWSLRGLAWFIRVLNGSGAAGTYLWSPAVNLSAPTQPRTNASPATTTAYTLRLTDGRGCSATDETTVTVFPNCVKPMEAFTPNGDGRNDRRLWRR